MQQRPLADEYGDTGLVPPFPDKEHWNFYEWRKGLDGGKPKHNEADVNAFDLPLNALLSLALQRMGEISDALGVENDYAEQAKQLNECIRRAFLDAETGLCADRVGTEASHSVLSNALAVLCGAISGATAQTVCEKLILDDTLTPISVSMQCFLFDALLATDKARYAPYIPERIEQTYRPMVELGLGTVWETERGEADFSNAGSLCHGWSAMPIYYYHILK